MKPVSTATAPARTSLRTAGGPDWNERAGRLFAEFERPAKAMVRRAFRGAFCADELDDIYASAWAGTLRALADRHGGLADDEIRSYVLTAVANQAGKELRRRRRKPTAPIELVGGVPDQSDGPEDRAASRERSQVTRDVLTSLPPRRRAVMLLRYGWGLEPSQVCSLIDGLSPRAYRKEITRGVDEVAQRMRAVESGSWCAEREPVLKAYAAGIAQEDETRQAKAHLAHCRSCSDFVARLAGHLHDLAGPAAAIGAIDGLDAHVTFGDRLVALGDRASALVGRGVSNGSDEATGQLVSAGGARGAGAAGAGVLTKLATVGVTGKLAVACVGGGIAATACVAAGMSPFGIGSDRVSPAAHEDAKRHSPRSPRSVVITEPMASELGNTQSVPPPIPASSEPSEDELVTEAAPAPAPEPESTTPTVTTTAPPEEQEFGVGTAAAPAPTPTRSSASAPAPSSPEPSPTEAAQQEFGP